MKNKLISLLLVSAFAVGTLTGCTDSKNDGNTQQTDDTSSSKPAEKKTIDADIEVIGGMDEFNSSLISYIEDKDLADKNYMISPTSYKAALCLAVAGADGKTKEELLRGMGFESEKQMNNWYALAYNSTVEFQKSLQDEKDEIKALQEDEEMGDYYFSSGEPDGAFQLVNSIWANEDGNCAFRDDYIKNVADTYDATAASKSANELTGAVNEWVNKATNGQIDKISEDLSKADLILANALYLRAGWEKSFFEGMTAMEDFTTKKGETVQKEMMNQQEEFEYYEEEGGKLIILPLDYGVKSAFIIGNISDLDKALSEAQKTEVDVKLPKMDMDSYFDSEHLIGFLQDRGVELAFRDDGAADFSKMCDTEVYIDQILQKTKIKTDEEGLEASAVTAVIMMEATAAMPEENEVKQFYANEPFKFIVYTQLENQENEILFYGQMVE